MGTATQPPEFLLISRTDLHKRNLDAFFLYQHTEIPALIVKLDDVVDTSADEPYIERFRNDVRRAEVIRPGQRFVGGVRADDENRYIVYIFIVHQVFQHAESIHYRHHDVQQNRAQLVFVLLELFYCALAVFSFNDCAVAERVAQHQSVELEIVNDEQSIAFLHLCIPSPNACW